MKIIIKPNPRHIFFSAFLAGCIASAALPALAVDLFGGGFLGNGLGAAVNGQVGVSTHINNTPVYAPLGADIDTRNRQIYRSDAQERTMRQRAATSIHQDMSIAPADIAPAAGESGYIKPRPIYNTGRIQGGHSYND